MQHPLTEKDNRMAHRNNFEFLTQGPISRVIPTMAVPTIISMMVTSFYNLADTYFVSQINTQSTAAVGVVFTIMSFFQAFGFFFGHGSGNFISRALGAKEKESPAVMAATGFVYALGFGILLTVIGLTLLTPLSRWLGSTPTILPYTEQYLGIILLGAPFIIGSLTLNLQMRFQGNAAYSMYGIMTGAVLNLALDPLLIFALGMGIRGAALATVISQTTALAWQMLIFSDKNELVHFRSGIWQLRGGLVKSMLAIGASPFAMNVCACIVVILINTALVRHGGDLAVGAYGIANRIGFLFFEITSGIINRGNTMLQQIVGDFQNPVSELLFRHPAAKFQDRYHGHFSNAPCQPARFISFIEAVSGCHVLDIFSDFEGFHGAAVEPGTMTFLLQQNHRSVLYDPIEIVPCQFLVSERFDLPEKRSVIQAERMLLHMRF